MACEQIYSRKFHQCPIAPCILQLTFPLSKMWMLILDFAMPLYIRKIMTQLTGNTGPHVLSLAFKTHCQNSHGGWLRKWRKNTWAVLTIHYYASMVYTIEISKINKYQWATQVKTWSSIHEKEGDISSTITWTISFAFWFH